MKIDLEVSDTGHDLYLQLKEKMEELRENATFKLPRNFVTKDFVTGIGLFSTSPQYDMLIRALDLKLSLHFPVNGQYPREVREMAGADVMRAYNRHINTLPWMILIETSSLPGGCSVVSYCSRPDQADKWIIENDPRINTPFGETLQ